MTENKDSGSSFTIGFIIGAVAGIAIGFLYAPEPGQKTRGLLREKAEKARETVEKAKEKASEAAEKTKEATAEAREKVAGKRGRKKTAK